MHDRRVVSLDLRDTGEDHGLNGRSVDLSQMPVFGLAKGATETLENEEHQFGTEAPAQEEASAEAVVEASMGSATEETFDDPTGDGSAIDEPVSETPLIAPSNINEDNEDIDIQFAATNGSPIVMTNSRVPGWLRFGKKKHHVIAVDVGTSKTYGYILGTKYFFVAPTMVYVLKKGGSRSDQILEFGEYARQREQRCPKGHASIRIMRHGYITDDYYMRPYMNWFVNQLYAANGITRGEMGAPIVVMSHYVESTEVHRRALVDCTMLAIGTKTVGLVDQVTASAIGESTTSRHRVMSPAGYLAADFGDGNSQAGVISNGLFVENGGHGEEVGGMDITRAIQTSVKSNKKVIIGTPTAIRIKETLATAIQPTREEGRNRKMSVRGRGVNSITDVEITQDFVFQAINPILNQVIGLVQNTLMHIHPEQAEMCHQNGLVISGGTSQIDRFPERISKENGFLPTIRAKHPVCSVIRGLIRAYEHHDLHETVITPYKDSERSSWIPIGNKK